MFYEISFYPSLQTHASRTLIISYCNVTRTVCEYQRSRESNLNYEVGIPLNKSDPLIFSITFSDVRESRPPGRFSEKGRPSGEPKIIADVGTTTTATKRGRGSFFRWEITRWKRRILRERIFAVAWYARLSGT